MIFEIREEYFDFIFCELMREIESFEKDLILASIEINKQKKEITALQI